MIVFLYDETSFLQNQIPVDIGGSRLRPLLNLVSLLQKNYGITTKIDIEYKVLNLPQYIIFATSIFLTCVQNSPYICECCASIRSLISLCHKRALVSLPVKDCTSLPYAMENFICCDKLQIFYSVSSFQPLFHYTSCTISLDCS